MHIIDSILTRPEPCLLGMCVSRGDDKDLSLPHIVASVGLGDGTNK